MNITPGTCWEVNRGDVSHERLDGEVIAVNLVTGRYYSMSGPAADTWSAIVGGRSGHAATELLQGIYGVESDIESGLMNFIAACEQAGLLIPTGSEESSKAPIAIPDDYQRTSWSEPILEEYEDLQDLILVDPVHDTSALGWPHVEDSPEQN